MIQQLLDMILKMFTSFDTTQPRYSGMPGHVANIYTYQPGLLEQAMGWLYPQRARTAPPTILAADWNRIMAASQMRQNLMSKVSETSPLMSATARFFMKEAGVAPETSKSIINFMNKSLIGQFLVRPMWQKFFGPGIEEQRAMSTLELSKTLMGYKFGKADMGGPEYGMGSEELMDLSRKLYSATYRDKGEMGLFKRRTSFGITEMTDVMRMGIAYGMPVLNKEQLTRDTSNLAGVIEAGMAIYHTMDKEGVIKNIMELTRGQIPITDTANLGTLIHKINAIAKVANVNIQAMQRISAEGAAIFEQLGLQPKVGAVLTAKITGISQAMVQGGARIFTPIEAARLGGRAGVRRILTVQAAEVLSSNAFKTMALMYGLAGPGEERKEIMARFKRGEKPDVKVLLGQEERIEKELAASFEERYGISSTKALKMASIRLPGELKYRQKQGQELMLKDFRDRYGDFELMQSMNLASARDLLMGQFSDKSIVNEMLKKARGDEQTELKLQQTVTKTLEEKGYTPEEAQAQAENIVKKAFIGTEKDVASLGRILTGVKDKDDFMGYIEGKRASIRDIDVAIYGRLVPTLGEDVARKRSKVISKRLGLGTLELNKYRVRELDEKRIEMVNVATQAMVTDRGFFDTFKRLLVKGTGEATISEAIASILPEGIGRVPFELGIMPKLDKGGFGFVKELERVAKLEERREGETEKGRRGRIFKEYILGWSHPSLMPTKRVVGRIMGRGFFTRREIFGKSGMWKNLLKARERVEGGDFFADIAKEAETEFGLGKGVIDIKEAGKQLKDVKNLSIAAFSGYLQSIVPDDQKGKFTVAEIAKNETLMSLYYSFLEEKGGPRGKEIIKQVKDMESYAIGTKKFQGMDVLAVELFGKDAVFKKGEGAKYIASKLTAMKQFIKKQGIPLREDEDKQIGIELWEAGKKILEKTGTEAYKYEKAKGERRYEQLAMAYEDEPLYFYKGMQKDIITGLGKYEKEDTFAKLLTKYGIKDQASYVTKMKELEKTFTSKAKGLEKAKLIVSTLLPGKEKYVPAGAGPETLRRIISDYATMGEIFGIRETSKDETVKKYLNYLPAKQREIVKELKEVDKQASKENVDALKNLTLTLKETIKIEKGKKDINQPLIDAMTKVCENITLLITAWKKHPKALKNK